MISRVEVAVASSVPAGSRMSPSVGHPAQEVQPGERLDLRAADARLAVEREAVE